MQILLHPERHDATLLPCLIMHPNKYYGYRRGSSEHGSGQDVTNRSSKFRPSYHSMNVLTVAFAQIYSSIETSYRGVSVGKGVVVRGRLET